MYTIIHFSLLTAENLIPESNKLIDISSLDVEMVKQELAKGYGNTLLEKLQNAVSDKLNTMIQINRSRMDYYDKFQKMINEYNLESRNAEIFTEQLSKFIEELNQEDQRAIAENLTEEQLAVFDLLIDPSLTFSDKDKKKIKKIAEDLLNILKREKLTLDWRKRLQAKAAVKVAIADVLDQLPETYTEELYRLKRPNAPKMYN